MLIQFGGGGSGGGAGTPGTPGAPGAPGASAYEIWKAQPGNSTGTVADYLASLKGPKGDPGPGTAVVQAWAPNTAVLAGELRTAPDGSLQQSKANQTTGATFNQNNWNPMVPGLEIGYAQIVASYSSPDKNVIDVPGLSIDVMEPSRPYMLKAFTYGLAGAVVNNYAYVQIAEYNIGSGALIGPLTSGQYYVAGAANTGKQTTAECRLTPATPGSTRRFRVQVLGGGTQTAVTIQAAATAPAFIQAVTV